MKRTFAQLLAVTLAFAMSAPAAAYTVILKDGSQLIAQKAPDMEGDKAIIILQSGTRTSIAADEIDIERTREANRHELGSAMVLEDGEFKGQTVEVEPQEERLTDLANRRPRGGAANRAPVARTPIGGRSGTGGSALAGQERTPYRNLEVLEAIQGAFRSQGVDSAKVYQGTSTDRLLIDIETNSEAAVFRSIKVAAGALTHVRTNISAAIDAFELVLTTGNRSRAGEFVMTTEDAAALTNGEIEVSNYFVSQVRF